MPYLGPYAILAILVCCIVFGLIFLAWAYGRWGFRRAVRRGRACSVCGFWGTELEVLTHGCTYKPDVRKRD